MIDVCTFAIVIKCRLFYHKLLFISDQQEQNKSDFYLFCFIWSDGKLTEKNNMNSITYLKNTKCTQLYISEASIKLVLRLSPSSIFIWFVVFRLNKLVSILMKEATKRDRPSGKIVQTEDQCHSRYGTIKIPLCSVAVSAG